MNKDIMEFFKDVFFEPPNGRDPQEFVGEDYTDASRPFDSEGMETLLKPEDLTITDNDEAVNPKYWADYYMFHDPLIKNMSNSVDIFQGPQSATANTLNKDYKKKNLHDLQSVSDIHMESLDASPGTYPKHAGIRSTMANSSAFDLLNRNNPEEQADITPAQPQDRGYNPNSAMVMQKQVTLQQPVVVEGKKYPKGTVFVYTEGQ